MGEQDPPEVRKAEQRLGRHYATSLLPLLRDGDRATDHPEVLLAVYAQICDSWRALTDVRFKLLALVPPVAGLGLFAVVSSGGPLAGSPTAARIGAALFGFLVTAGLYIYDLRNSQLYDDLISRGRRAELELGLDTGIFLGRKRPRPGSLVRHGLATGLIYGTVLVAWALAVPAVLLGR